MNKKIRNMIIALAAIILVTTGVVQTIPQMTLKAEAIEPYAKGELAPVNSEIAIKQGEMLVADSDGKQLFVNTDDLSIRVVDEKSGKEWSSQIKDAANNKEKSIVNITYIGKDDKKVEWDAYSNIIEQGNYEIAQIEDGARITMHFQNGTKTIEQLVPSYITKEHYEERFISPIEQKEKQGQLTSKQVATYKSVLNSVYAKDTGKGGLKLKSGNTLPPSGIKQLNELVEVIGYTEDMVRADNEAAGLDIEMPQMASFKIVMNLTLDEGDLLVNIPTYECVSGNDFFTLQKIEVLPNFGYASSDVVKDGYIFVPDGSGALFELNSYNASYPQYSRPLYNNTYFDQMYTRDTFSENVSMPVFGIMYGKDENATHGMMGIIESGEELSSVNVQLGTDDSSTGGGINNKVYSAVDTSQYSRVKLQGPYAEESTRYLTSTGPIEMDYTVRYKFFNEATTYYDFAEAYKTYLSEKHGMELTYKNEPKLYLEVLGALTLPKHFVGVPYDEVVSMTTYNELGQIIEDLSDMNLVVDYQGAFNNGEKTGIMNKVELVKENGSKKELEALMQVANEKGAELLLGTNLMTIKDASFPFKAKVHAINGYDGKPAEIYKYNLIDGKFSPSKVDRKYLLHPQYFKDVMDNFLGATETISNISVVDVPNTYYANYNVKDIVTPIQANAVIERELQRLDESKEIVAFNNPNANTLPYCDYAVNISRESSPYGTMYTAVPFRQLVMNGLVEYTTLNVNMSKERMEYYLLQALEVGSYPKFTISYQKEDILKDTPYTHYFTVGYENLKPRIEELYSEYENAFNQIGTTEIVNHRLVAEGVFETEYANGVKVLTNYNEDAVTVEGHSLSPVGFKIIK